ncbi:MAG: translation initiation factor IF-3 [Anaerolineales bacterium]|nr:translation initiation factor IF-3 [Anaerolineales bacterium]MCB0014018.1 translation initiation factor IF-3 [Anaerolineales bacterium]MCB0019358.1 translation initiation factor IF-3 [Anaerolineales bacterium]MCB8959833.1 translation initiation factor IF-3 [Ardenticatenales bacterium]
MLIDQENKNRGVVSTNEARDIAFEAGLDLVEVAPNARPPVCRIMDFSKFSYEQKKKYREARKKQKTIDIKTIKLKIKTGDFHQAIQVKKARGWLEDAKKVKVSIRFYGRERDYPELAQDTMKEIAAELADVSTIEQQPMMEGWSMTMMLAPTDTIGKSARQGREDGEEE